MEEQPLCQFSTYCSKQKRLRHCRFGVKPPETLCSIHREKERRTCPYDSSHSVHISKYDKHCRKCPAKPPDKAAIDGDGRFIENVSHRKLNNSGVPLVERYTDAQFAALKETVERSADILGLRDLPLEELSHPCSATIYPHMGSKRRKVVGQESSILAHMEREGILQPLAVYVELGAGSGGLSRHIQAATRGASHHVLVDLLKLGSRSTYDREMVACAEPGAEIKRHVGDVRHLHIHDVLGRGVDRSTSRRFVFVSKHFCGDATDIALRFIVSQLPFFSGVNTTVSVCIATCCHAKCSAAEYSNMAWVSTILRLSPDMFEMMCAMGAWSTLSVDTTIDSLAYGLHRDQRRCFGKECATLVDQGRLEYLRGHGFVGHLVKYTDQTPENTLLIATWHPQPENGSGIYTSNQA